MDHNAVLNHIRQLLKSFADVDYQVSDTATTREIKLEWNNLVAVANASLSAVGGEPVKIEDLLVPIDDQSVYTDVAKGNTQTTGVRFLGPGLDDAK